MADFTETVQEATAEKLMKMHADTVRAHTLATGGAALSQLDGDLAVIQREMLERMH